MSHPFPHRYSIDLTWSATRKGLVRAENGQTIKVGPPPQFDGDGLAWSPEDMLLSALGACLMTTFCALAEKIGVSFSHYEDRVVGTLDKGADGIRFIRIVHEVKLGSEEFPKAKEILLKAKKYCIISNALAVQPEVEVERSNEKPTS